MKKIIKVSLVILASLSINLNLFSQEKFNSYQNDLLKKTYDINISFDNENKFTLFIDATSFDKQYLAGGIILMQDKYKNFITALNEAKIKYIEWIKTAQQNNVKSLNKDMEYISKVSSYFGNENGDRWMFQIDVYLKFNFMIKVVDNNVKYLLIVNTGELRDTKNDYLKSTGLALIFSSVKEIDDFLSIISMDKINSFISKPKKEELFK